jgi:cell division protein FtsB
MNINRKHKQHRLLVGMAALALAGCAAYFSVFGLTQLFVGASIAGIILFSALEFGKIVAVSYLQNYWKMISLFRKFYMILGVSVLMLITSMGIYGFLSAAYESTSTNMKNVENKVKVVENKKLNLNIEINRYQEQIDFRTKRLTNLSDLRSQQESRLDKLYDNESYYQVRSVEKTITDANTEIDNINKEITKYNENISLLSDSISKYDIQILEMQNNEFAQDLGTFKYISRLLKKPMDSIVNFLILFIIIVFDPMSIAFLIAFNQITNLLRNNGISDKPNSNKPILDKSKNRFSKLKKTNIKEDKPTNDYLDTKPEIIEDFWESTYENLDNEPEITEDFWESTYEENEYLDNDPSANLKKEYLDNEPEIFEDFWESTYDNNEYLNNFDKYYLDNEPEIIEDFWESTYENKIDDEIKILEAIKIIPDKIIENIDDLNISQYEESLTTNEQIYEESENFWVKKNYKR